jgi:uncharacterized membrane protein
MHTLPLHPAIVHVPLGLAMIMPLVAAALTIAVWRGKLPRGALGLLTVLQLVLAGSGLAAAALGDAAAKQAAAVAPRDAIEAHEEAAEAFVWVAVAVLAVSVVALVVPRARAAKVAALVTAGTLAVAALALNAGMKGGELVFRYGAGSTAAQGHVAAPAERPGDRD